MHRGKNRSRKPVEILTTAAGASATTTTETGNIAVMGVNPTTASSMSSMNKNTYNSLSSFPSQLGSCEAYDTHHLLYQHSSSRPPPGMSLSSQDHTNTHLLLESGSFRDQRYLQGGKGDIGEHAFFNGARRGYPIGSSIDEPWQLNQFKHGGTAATPSFSQQRQQGYPYLELKSEASKQEKQHGHEGYVWGRDFDCELTMRVEREIDPQKTRDSWNDSSSTTQLSISMPTSSHHDFFLSNSRSP